MKVRQWDVKLPCGGSVRHAAWHNSVFPDGSLVFGCDGNIVAAYASGQWVSVFLVQE